MFITVCKYDARSTVKDNTNKHMHCINHIKNYAGHKDSTTSICSNYFTPEACKSSTIILLGSLYQN